MAQTRRRSPGSQHRRVGGEHVRALRPPFDRAVAVEQHEAPAHAGAHTVAAAGADALGPQDERRELPAQAPPALGAHGRWVSRQAVEQEVAAAAGAADLAAAGARVAGPRSASPRSACAPRCAGSSASWPRTRRGASCPSRSTSPASSASRIAYAISRSCFMPRSVSSRPRAEQLDLRVDQPDVAAHVARVAQQQVATAGRAMRGGVGRARASTRDARRAELHQVEPP